MASHYQPSNEQEVFDVMNVLDDRLSHSNSAVVMATVKLFLHLTLRMPATHQQVRKLPHASLPGAEMWESSARGYTFSDGARTRCLGQLACPGTG